VGTNPQARSGQVGMKVSLDHTIYFHNARNSRVDRWLLVESDSPWAADERALVMQRIWDPEAGAAGDLLPGGTDEVEGWQRRGE